MTNKWIILNNHDDTLRSAFKMENIEEVTFFLDEHVKGKMAYLLTFFLKNGQFIPAYFTSIVSRNKAFMDFFDIMHSERIHELYLKDEV